jgi:hypothetical protein
MFVRLRHLTLGIRPISEEPVIGTEHGPYMKPGCRVKPAGPPSLALPTESIEDFVTDSVAARDGSTHIRLISALSGPIRFIASVLKATSAEMKNQ